MGPYFLVNLLGLDTVLHVAEHLHESYGDRFYVPEGDAAAGGRGQARRQDRRRRPLLADGEPNVEGDAEPDVDELVELLTLKTFVEACLVLEEGVATHRDIDVGMMAGAGLDPRRGLLPPFMKADIEGLDVVLERLESATERHGERFAPPLVLRRLVAQGRLGQKSGQGFYPYAQPDDEQPGETVKLETRGDVAIAWLANGLMNSIAPQVIADLRAVWEKVEASGVRALVIASSNPLLFSAGADIKAFTAMDEAGGRELLETAHALLRELRALEHRHHRRGQRPGLRRRLRAGDGLRRAHRRAVGALRPARGQARDHPRLRRHAAPAAARGREQGPGDEPRGRRRSAPRRPTSSASSTAWSLDHELLDTALAWARKLAGQAPLAVGAIKEVSARATSTRASRPRRPRFAARLRQRGRPRGHRRLPGQAPADVARAVDSRVETPGRPRARGRLGRRAHRRGHLGALRDPRLPLAGHRAVGERRPDGGRPHRRLARGPRALLALLRQPLPDARGQGAQRRPPRAGRARAPRPPRRGRHPEHRHAPPPRGHARARRGPRDASSPPRAWPAARATRWPRSASAWPTTRSACPTATAASR